MPLVPMRQILDEAAKGGYGVGAFNVNNMEQIQAIMQAAHETPSPVIIQARARTLTRLPATSPERATHGMAMTCAGRPRSFIQPAISSM